MRNLNLETFYLLQLCSDTNGDVNHHESSQIPLTKDDPSRRTISEGNISIVGLKRRVGLISGTALIVGTMIGNITSYVKVI